MISKQEIEELKSSNKELESKLKLEIGERKYIQNKFEKYIEHQEDLKELEINQTD